VLPACGARCFAWALLSNHVHLVLQSGEVPIGAVLKRVLTGFALRFNLRHDRVGYVLQGRFGSRLVSSNADLMNLIRYVHLNPIRAGLARDLGELGSYAWSGHGALIGERPAWPFESVPDALALFGPEPTRARRRLEDWMARGMVEPPPSDAPAFSRAERDLGELVRSICAQAGVSEESLLSGSRDRSVCRARSLICYLAVGELGIEGRIVASALRVTPGAVTQLVRRGEELARRVGPQVWKSGAPGEF